VTLAAERITASVVPLQDAVELNPRPERGSLSDDLEVSFIPMAAVEAATGRLDPSTVRKYGDVKKGYTYFREGDVLFAKITPCMENGKVAVARGLRNSTGCGSTEFHVLRPRPGVDSQYVYHFVSSAHLRAQAARHMTGAVGQKRVPASFLEQSQLPLPELAEQRRIVAEIEQQFSRVDDAVANLKRVKANLKRYKAAVLKAAVGGRLAPTEAELAGREGRTYETGAQLLKRILDTRREIDIRSGNRAAPIAVDDSNLPKLPDGWCWASIGQLCGVVRGGSPRPAGDPRYFGGPIPWITVGPITADEADYLRRVPEGLTEEGKERSRYIEPHTLLLTNSGATLGVPKISLIGGCINDGVAALLDVDYPLKLYLLHFLRTKTNSMRRINQGAAQPNLNTTIIRSIEVPLPPIHEQDRIIKELERRFSVIRKVEAQVAANLLRAERARQAYLAKLLGVAAAKP
jgi:type I restriction enzyme S subunit